MPSTNTKFWSEKIAANKKRDRNVNREYKKMGWKVLRFWGHSVKKDLNKIVSQINEALSRDDLDKKPR